MWQRLRSLVVPAKAVRLSSLSELPASEEATAQKDYVEKHAKWVQPDVTLGAEFFRIGSEYARLTISYLVLGNAGGLTALLAVFPLVRDSNQTWLVNQTHVAIVFAVGLFFGGTSGALAYYNYTMHGIARWGRAANNDLLLKMVDYKFDRDKVEQAMSDNWTKIDSYDFHAGLSYRVSVYCALISACAWSVGAYLLVVAISRI